MNRLSLRRNGWRPWHLVAAVVLAALGFAATLDAWRDMLAIALGDEEASHIFLVPIIAAWLVYVRRDRWRYCVPRHHWIGPLLVAVGWAASSFGYYNAAQALWHGGAVLILIGCVLTALGGDVLRRFAPAFVVLIFLVPVPGSIRLGIALPLQEVLARMTWTAFDVAGVHVEQFGNLIRINDQAVQVAEACNGLRMVFTLVLVSYAVAFGTPLKGYARFLLIALSPLSALVCNFARMVPTVWLYGNASHEAAAGFHDVAGWIMLFLAFLLLMGIIRVLRWALLPVARYTLAYD
jgi:exosortase